MVGMTGSNPYSYLFGPFVALMVVAGMAFLLRWSSARGGSHVERVPRPGELDEYGLLVPVATPPGRAEGEALRRNLQANGVRATLTTTTEGLRLLVFPNDVARARELIAG